jgi:signal transduction histidine kinase
VERVDRVEHGATNGGYDQLPDGLLVADATGRVVVLNSAGAALLGCQPGAARGRDFRAVLPVVDSGGRDWWACTTPYAGLASRTGQPERRLTLTGSAPSAGTDLLVTARYVRAQPRGAVIRLVVAFRDTAARNREERNRADLVSTVAHELRSPLTSIKGFTATLLAKWDRFSDEQKKLMLRTVNADADRVTRLLAELLDVSRIEADRLEVRRQVVDVAAVAADLLASRVALGEPPERFELRTSGQPPEMWLDPDKVRQVLDNLVENAARHGAGTVAVTVAGSSDGTTISVADEGAGIPVADRKRVFAKFWRDNRHGGTGLGLFIAKGLVEAHGGTIEAGSAPGGGALFRVFLPPGVPTYPQ